MDHTKSNLEVLADLTDRLAHGESAARNLLGLQRQGERSDRVGEQIETARRTQVADLIATVEKRDGRIAELKGLYDAEQRELVHLRAEVSRCGGEFARLDEVRFRLENIRLAWHEKVKSLIKEGFGTPIREVLEALLLEMEDLEDDIPETMASSDLGHEGVEVLAPSTDPLVASVGIARPAIPYGPLDEDVEEPGLEASGEVVDSVEAEAVDRAAGIDSVGRTKLQAAIENPHKLAPEDSDD